MLLRPEECCQGSPWALLQTLSLVHKCLIYNASLKILGSICATPLLCRRAAATLLRRFR